LLAAALLLTGCAGVPTGPAQRPEVYPDRTSVDEAWRTFLWAWKQGDVEVLGQVTGWRMHAELRKQIEANGAEAVSAWYRDDAEALRVLEAEWTTRGEEMAYLRVVLSSKTVSRVEVDFSFVERPDGWVLTEKRPVR
jgi:hypothetical protein